MGSFPLGDIFIFLVLIIPNKQTSRANVMAIPNNLN